MLTVKTKYIFAPIDDIEDGYRISIGRHWVGRRKEKPNSIETLHIKENIPDLGPDVELWKDYLKLKIITEEEYVIRFNNYIRKNKEKIKKILDKLRQDAIRDNKPITLLCKCEEGYFCHRYLVQAMLLEGLDNYLARTEYDSLWRGLKRQSVSSQQKGLGKGQDEGERGEEENQSCEQTKHWIRPNLWKVAERKMEKVK